MAGAKIEPLRPKRACPECGRTSNRDTFPFCSTRCKNIDLSRWLSGAYVIPGPPIEEDDDNPGSPETNE